MEVAAPWCGTLSTSAVRSTPASSITCCAGSSGSVANSTESSPRTARTTIASLLVSDSVSCQQRSGDRISRRTSPTCRTSPARGWRTGTCSAATASASARASEESSGQPGSSSSPTGKRASTSGSPTMWSACGWLATTTSSRRTPTAASSVAICAGSGPPSTSIATPPGEVSSAESPCPTSKKRTESPPGGPAEMALDQTNRGTRPAPTTTAARGGRRPERIHHASPPAAASPRTSVAIPPPVIHGIGARAARSASSSR